MSDATIISITASVILGCGTIIWYFVRRLIASIDKQSLVLDAMLTKIHDMDTRLVKLEVLQETAA